MTVAVASGAAVASVVAYLSDQRSAVKETEIRVEFSRQNADLEEVVRGLKMSIAELERRGVQKSPKMLAMKSIPMDAKEASTLPKNYSAMGNIYINSARDLQWESRELTEAEFASMSIMGMNFLIDGIRNQVSAIRPKSVDEKALKRIQEFQNKHKVYVWTNKNVLKFKAQQSFTNQSVALNAYAYAAIEEIGENYSEELFEAILGQSLSSWGDTMPGLKKVWDRSMSQIRSKETLGSLVLTTGLSERAMVLLFDDASSEAFSETLEPELMHFDTELKFDRVAIPLNPYFNCTGASSTVFVRRELAFIFAGRSSYLAQIQVPSCDRRGASFEWTAGWLNGLRIAKN
jgi:hypothetical protein